jgi:hypothetical protein
MGAGMSSKQDYNFGSCPNFYVLKTKVLSPGPVFITGCKGGNVSIHSSLLARTSDEQCNRLRNGMFMRTWRLATSKIVVTLTVTYNRHKHLDLGKTVVG